VYIFRIIEHIYTSTTTWGYQESKYIINHKHKLIKLARKKQLSHTISLKEKL